MIKEILQLKGLPHQEPQIAKLPPVPNSGRRPCQPTGLRVSQQEGASQPTGRRESANHPGNQNYLVFGLAELSKFTSQNLRLAAL
jgi:hypothetical protein